jgi:uncharacterized protein (TIGR02246 family)
MFARTVWTWLRIRRPLGILGLTFLIFLPLSEKPVGSADGGKQNPDNRKLISAAVENLVSAWNEKNSDMIAKLFLPDAVLVMPTGNVTRSRNSIRQRLISEWQGKLKDSRLSHSVEAISFQGNDAVVKGRYRLDGMSILGVDTAPEGPFVFRHRKQQGRWMIAKAEILRNKSS